jgi:hypothetical protein
LIQFNVATLLFLLEVCHSLPEIKSVYHGGRSFRVPMNIPEAIVQTHGCNPLKRGVVPKTSPCGDFRAQVAG